MGGVILQGDDEGDESQRRQEQHQRHDDRRAREVEQRRHEEHAPGADESADGPQGVERAHDGTLTGALDLNARPRSWRRRCCRCRDRAAPLPRRRPGSVVANANVIAAAMRIARPASATWRAPIESDSRPPTCIATMAGQTGGEQQDRDVGGGDVQPLADGGQRAAVAADDEPVRREQERHGDGGSPGRETSAEIGRLCGGGEVVMSMSWIQWRRRAGGVAVLSEGRRESAADGSQS